MRIHPVLSAAVFTVLANVAFAQEPVREEAAATLEVAYTLDGIANVRGGLRRGAATLHNIDVLASFDLERSLGWDGVSAFAYGLGNRGGAPSELAGDIQTADNIEADDAWRIYEAFVERRMRSDRVSVLAGLYNVNSEFDVLASAQALINSSFGVGPDLSGSREWGPSIFPVTSLAVRARAFPHPRWYVQAAGLDGVPGHPDDPHAGPFHFEENDGLLLIAETGLLSGPERSGAGRNDPQEHTVKLGIGAWFYTARFERLGPGRGLQRGNAGVYVLGEALLVSDSRVSGRGLWGFVRVGMADDAVNQIAAYTGAGLTYVGLFRGRAQDVASVGVAVAHAGNAFKRQAERRSGPIESREAAFELTYAAALAPWLAVQADVQLIVNPGMDRAVDSALLTGVRVVLQR